MTLQPEIMCRVESSLKTTCTQLLGSSLGSALQDLQTPCCAKWEGLENNWSQRRTNWMTPVHMSPAWACSVFCPVLGIDSGNHCSLGDNKCPQDLVSVTETVQNCNGKAAANTNGGRNNNRDDSGETNGNSPETQCGFFQRDKNGNDNQQNRGSGNNRPNHQQNSTGITCCACNQPRRTTRNCPLNKRGKNSQQHIDRQAHFQQCDKGLEGNQVKNVENTEGNIHDATQLAVPESGICWWQQLSSPEWKLLHSQSTTDIFFNPEHLTNICEAKDTLHLQTKGGVLKCNTRGYQLGQCWKCSKFDTSCEEKQCFVQRWATKKLKRSCFLTRWKCIFIWCFKWCMSAKHSWRK